MYFKLFYERIKATTETYLNKMTNNFKMIAVIIIGIILLYVFRMQNSDYNLNRTISACIVAKKKTSKSFDVEQAKKFCKKEIKKKIKGGE